MIYLQYATNVTASKIFYIFCSFVSQFTFMNMSPNSLHQWLHPCEKARKIYPSGKQDLITCLIVFFLR